MKKVVFAIGIMMLLTSMQAQEKGLHVLITGGTGLTGLEYKFTDEDGSRKALLGGNAGIGIQYFFNRHFGVSLGIDLAFYNTKSLYSDIKSLNPIKDQVDNENESYNLYLKLSKWEERQRTAFLEIPLMLNFQHKFDKRQVFGIYLGAGPKMQIPVTSSFSREKGSVGVTARYIDNNLVLSSEEETGGMHGISEYEKLSLEGKNNLKFGLAVTGEAGILLGITPRIDLRIGASIDYGLINIKKENAVNLFEPERGLGSGPDYIKEDVTYKGILNTVLVEKIKPYSIQGNLGIKIKIGKLEERDNDEDIVKTMAKAMKEQQRSSNAGIDTLIKRLDSLLKHPYPGYYAGQNVPEGGYPAGYAYGSYPAWFTPATEDTLWIGTNYPTQGMGTPKTAVAGAYPTGAAMKNPRFAALVDSLIESIYFDLNKVILRKDAIKVLDSKVALMQRYPGLVMAVVGHTCDLGGEAYNEDLSMRRARAAREYMIMRGINPARVEVVPMGKRQPTYPNNSEYNREHNRRVDFIIVR
ncbi:MAG: OmpA family protein [Bacteroidales bacterium]|jgi:outer membrane protein OmpA-like peptidoglycan-associated protein|nr:OmpA family protein [Bacteroidales bacterium]